MMQNKKQIRGFAIILMISTSVDKGLNKAIYLNIKI